MFGIGLKERNVMLLFIDIIQKIIYIKNHYDIYCISKLVSEPSSCGPGAVCSV